MTVIKFEPASYNFFYTSTSEFLTSALLKHRITKVLKNINDDGDNNEKTKKLKTRVGMFKNMGGNVQGRNFLGGNFPGGSLMGGNFPGGSLPDTIANK